MPQEYRDLRADSSLNLTDRHGVPLRRNLSAREGVNSWTSLEEMPPILIDAVLAAEDKRFSYHPGVDPLAMGRACFDNIRHGRVVSGASTITQQLLRTLSPPSERGWKAKLWKPRSLPRDCTSYPQRGSFVSTYSVTLRPS